MHSPVKADLEKFHFNQIHLVKIGTASDRYALKAKIEEKLKAGELRIADEKQVPTFGEYARKFLDGYAKTHLKHTTQSSYEKILENHLSHLQDRSLNQITRADLKKLIYDKLKSGLAPQSVRNIKNFISGILNHALEDEIIAANPASRLGRHIKGKDRKSDVNPLNREEARIFLEAILNHYPRFYPFFLCALRTGMRLGELLALEWGDIDFHSGFIEVRRAFAKGRIDTPKNGKIRRVDMSPQLAETLRALQTERKREALAKWDGRVPELVFVNEEGRMVNFLVQRFFLRGLEKAGLRRVRFHDLRHTFASLLIQNGEPLAYVKEQLGHGSIQMTVDTYGHLEPGKNRQAVAKLDDNFSTYVLSDRVQIGCKSTPK